MARVAHWDFETYSAAPPKTVGAYRYAADASARILMLAIAWGDEEPQMLLPREICKHVGIPFNEAAHAAALEMATAPDVLIYAHNAQFEIAVSTHRLLADLGIPPPALAKWRCTAAMARRAALPAALEKLAEALKLPQQKDKRGSALIQKFCVPVKSGKAKGTRFLPSGDPAAFQEFIDYCLQDVRAEREVHRRLKSFELVGTALASFELDKKINARGVPVNLHAIDCAQRIVDETTARLVGEFNAITGYNPTQRDRVVEWMKAHGYPRETLRAADMKAMLKDTSWAAKNTKGAEALRALQIRKEISFAAVKKLKSMRACAVGGRVYGTLLWHGASTGRWSGKLIQPQNFKRNNKGTQLAYSAIQKGLSADEIDMLFGAPLETVAACIRHNIHDPTKKVLDCDFTAVEARLACWVAGQDDAVERYRNGAKEYEAMAAYIFGKQVSEIAKDSAERWLGKTVILGCGYQMGHKKFLATALAEAEKQNVKIELTPALAEKAVTAFRERFWRLVETWYACDNAARAAIKNAGIVYSVGKYLSFYTTTDPNSKIPFLVMVLPSKRSIVYPYPAIEYDAEEGRHSITYWGKLKTKAEEKEEVGEAVTEEDEEESAINPFLANWGRVKTYGGKLFENAIQGIAFDLMSHAGTNAMREGFDLFSLVHDQALASLLPQHAEDAKASLASFEKCFTSLPTWAADFPVAVEAKITDFYTK